MEDAQGPRNIGMHYERTAKSFYEPFWREGVPVDVIHMEADFSRYKLLVAPMLYMLKEGTAERIEQFVQNGGHLLPLIGRVLSMRMILCSWEGFLEA